MRADEPDPQVRDVLDRLEALDVPDFDGLEPARARDLFETLRAQTTRPGDVATEDVAIDGPDGDLPARVYRPDDPERTLVFYHGGGFVVGSVESHDSLARALADRTTSTVVSVEYRLAPEHPFPAAVHDAYVATTWAAENAADLGGDDLVVAGDSAGGTLAAVVSLLARDRDGPSIDYQVLVYPATSQSDDWPSVSAPETGQFLTSDEMAWFGERYLADPIDAANPYAFPLNACEFADLPPATVVTAGFDVLHDEGVAYATALEEAGVPVIRRNYPAMIHGFVGMLGEVDAALDAVDAIADDLAEPLP